MKAAIVQAAGAPPVYGDFPAPSAPADDEEVVVNMTASALSNLTKMRASGTHYTSVAKFPFVPGYDGVGTLASGERVYFASPNGMYGALGEQSLVKRSRTRPIPDGLDDVAAAALANPGMSAWASMVNRARLQKGETVLINGATGTSGRLAVQIAKALGAGKIIATARNAAELEALKPLGVDVAIAFSLPEGEDAFKAAVVDQYKQKSGRGIDVIIDYLYGPSASIILNALPNTLQDGHRVRYVNVGSSSQVENIAISASLLRSTGIEMMGSGLKSVSEQDLLDSIAEVFNLAIRLKLSVDPIAVPLADISKAWAQKGAKPRIVITI